MARCDHNWVVDHVDPNVNPATGRENPIEYSVCTKCGEVKSRGL